MQRIDAQKALVAAFLVLSVSACGRLADNYEINPIVTGPDGAQTGPDGKPVGFNTFNIEKGTLPDGKCGYTLAAGIDAAAIACRNRLMDHLIMLSDQRCATHKATIEANAAGSNFAFSSLTTLLGGAGAIVTGADAARALAGSAGAVSGVHADWNESIYQKNVATAIVAKIDENRRSILDKMSSARNNKDAVYTVDAMLADVYRYHDSCSFYSGLMSLGKSTTAPLTADALRGRIVALRAEIADNNALAEKNPDVKNQVTAMNASLMRALQHLSIQLGVVESRSGDVASAAEASPGLESAPTGGTAPTTKDSSSKDGKVSPAGGVSPPVK